MCLRVSLVSCLALPAVGCIDDARSYSAPVGINLEATSADTMHGLVADEKQITTESGNPYSAFVGDAREELGRDPSRIGVDKVELSLGASSSGVASLGEVFAGTVEVVFKMNDTDSLYKVANKTVDASASVGPIALDPEFPFDSLSGDQYSKLLGGSFEVMMRGSAAAGFEAKGADVDLQFTFTFVAFD